MTILTRAELETRLGAETVKQLTDLENMGVANAARVDAALADAEAEVMGYVRAATSDAIPDPAPSTLKRLVSIVAHYNLWNRACKEDSPVYIAYRDAVRELHGIATGKVVLFGSAEGAAVPRGAAVWTPARQMTDATLARMLAFQPGGCNVDNHC
jgi:phage gp36-like protein